MSQNLQWPFIMRTQQNSAIFLSITLCLAAAAAEGDEPHEGSVNGNVMSRPATNALPQVNQALVDTSHWIASSNLVGSAAPSRPSPGTQRFQLLFETGQKLRQQKHYALARKNFVTLLESDAPGALQRTALLELALMAQEQGELARAQQVFSQYIKLYPNDPSVTEILLRQGLLYRQMGVTSLALAKFYAVMTTSISSKAGSVYQYQRLVLLAQTEIADTYFLQGKHEEAAEFYTRINAWAWHQSCSTIIVNVLSDVPRETIKEKLGRLFERTEVFAKTENPNPPPKG